MTDQQITIACAGLDGWKHHADGGVYKGESHPLIACGKPMPNYLTSYDAIIPLAQKQSEDVKDRIEMSLNCFRNRIDANPKVIAIALLKAVGKWEE